MVLFALAVLAVAGCSDDTGGDDAGVDDTGVDDAGGDDASGDAGPTEAQVLCGCLLVSCHDPFHAQYGVDDGVAIAACEAEAGALPRAEMPVMSGNFLECRAGFCEGAAMDDTMCAAALGGTPCQ